MWGSINIRYTPSYNQGNPVTAHFLTLVQFNHQLFIPHGGPTASCANRAPSIAFKASNITFTAPLATKNKSDQISATLQMIKGSKCIAKAWVFPTQRFRVYSS